MNFLGYVRPDGSVGVRNYIGVISTAVCGNEVTGRIARQIEGAVNFLHGQGCAHSAPDLEQVTIRRMDAGLGETPAALLTGSSDVLDHFDYLGSEMAEDVRWLRLEPRAAESDFSAVELGFVDTQLRRIVLIDRLGQRTRILLSAIDAESAVADEYFTFEVPDGVDVIDEDDL